VALHPGGAGAPPPPPGPRLYHGADWAEGQPLKALLEGDWIDALMRCTGVPAERLPLLWDMDFLFGGASGYVLCEINVSSVSPFPPSATSPLVAAIKARLAEQRSG
jgi:hypothetical protein